jgi:hypothetical protein
MKKDEISIVTDNPKIKNIRESQSRDVRHASCTASFEKQKNEP